MEVFNMILNEKKGNLFELDNNKYSYAHCISLDCEMGMGIAKEFNARFSGMKTWLRREIKVYYWNFPKTIPCFKNGKLRVFNLITKEKYWKKPTYSTIEKCITEMAEQCARHNIKYLAMPKIGCGLDRLSWPKVREIIKEEFKNLDIEIEVRYL